MRTSILSLSLLAMPLIVACGDDGKDNVDAPPPIDAKEIDAPPDAGFGGFDADEGGEVRVEYTIFPNDARATRVTAFAYKDAGTTKFFSYVDENGCTDISTPALKALHWPTAQNANRTYHDLGSVTITPVAGNTTTSPLEVPRAGAMPTTDPFFRSHPEGEWFFKQFPLNGMGKPGGVSDTEQYTAEKSTYDVKFGGSADLPEQTFDGALYMPANFSIAGDTAHPAGAIYAPEDEPQTFTWDTPADTPTNDTEILGLVAVTGPNGPAFLCIEPNDGSITVPKELINTARTVYPTGGTVARQTLSHAVRELQENDGPSGKRIDIVGVWCYAGTAFNTTAPTLK